MAPVVSLRLTTRSSNAPHAGVVAGSRSMGLGAVPAGGGAALNHRLMEYDPCRGRKPGRRIDVTLPGPKTMPRNVELPPRQLSDPSLLPAPA